MNREKVSDTHRTSNLLQKQPSGGVHMKKSSENMQQIYRRTLMPKYDFNATLFKSHFGIFVLLLHIFRTSFLKKTPGGLLLLLTVICTCKKDNVGNLYTEMLFRFQWQIGNLSKELGLGPLFFPISPLRLTLIRYR